VAGKRAALPSQGIGAPRVVIAHPSKEAIVNVWKRPSKLVVATMAALAWPLTSVTTTGCGGEDDDCLVAQENCTTAYVEKEYGDGRGCCSGLSCETGMSGILICQ
jgi:hypothetical protein